MSGNFCGRITAKMQDTSSLLSVQNLVKQFPVRGGGLFEKKQFKTAVSDVSFAIAPGKTLALVGESGSVNPRLA